MNAYVYTESEDGWSLACELRQDSTYTIGRSRTCDIVVQDAHSSKAHVRLVFQDGNWFVSDLETSNGTLVNDDMIHSAYRLSPGDTITIGSSTRLLYSSEPPTKGSISNILDDLKTGVDQAKERAQRVLFEHYYDELCRLARRKSQGLNQAVEDEHDAVNSALESVFNALQDERLPNVDNRDELWRVMAAFTAWKVHAQRERQQAKKRGYGFQKAEVTDDALADVVPVDANAILQEQLSNVRDNLDEELRCVFDLRLLGHTNAEVADQLNCSERTVERKMKKIRDACDGLL